MIHRSFAAMSVALSFGCSQPVDAAQDEAAAAAGPVRYELEPEHSQIEIVWDYGGMVKDHMVFTRFDGAFELDFENPENSAVDVTVDMDSVWTGIERMEANLKSEWYFDVANHPTARFTATAFEKTGENTGVMTGDLTVRDVTLPVEVDVTLNFRGVHPFAEVRDDPKWDTVEALGFSAQATVSRHDFGISLLQIIPEFVTVNVELALERRTAPLAEE